MITIQVSANASNDNIKVYWSIKLPDSIAAKQLRPSLMMGVMYLKDFNQSFSELENCGIAELKALNILFCFENGLHILDTKKLETAKFNILCSSFFATSALRGGGDSQSSSNKDLLHSSIPASMIFYGAKFNQLSQFVPDDTYHLRNDSFSITNIPDSLLISTEIGFLSMTRKALESFSRRQIRKNPYQQFSQILQTSHLTIKYQSIAEREQRIQRSGYDGDIVCIENSDGESGLRIIIPKRIVTHTSGIESHSIVTSFYQVEGDVLSGKNNQITSINKDNKFTSNYNVYEDKVMYLEIDREAKLVKAQFDDNILTIDMYSSPQLELNYIDAAFLIINLMHLNVDPQKRVKIFTNEKIIVSTFTDIKNIDHHVNSKLSEKLRERILMLMYKTRLFANVRLSARELRSLKISKNIEEYDQINFDVFCKVRQREKMMVVKPHAFSSFVKRVLPEQLDKKNPLAYLFKIIKYNRWSVVVKKDAYGSQHWYNFDTNSLLVVETNESNNAFNIITFWRGNKYDNPAFKDLHPEKFERIETVIASSIDVTPIKIIN